MSQQIWGFTCYFQVADLPSLRNRDKPATRGRQKPLSVWVCRMGGAHVVKDSTAV